MKARSEADGDVFLPNPEPLGPVEYVFVCMEPSLCRRARSPGEAKARVEAGIRNFVSSVEDFILHFCIRQYLCEPAEHYHITDLSKGAMLVERASIDRSPRYDRWYGPLVEELDLVAKPGAGIFAVGNAVAQHLTRREFPRPITRVVTGRQGLAKRGVKPFRTCSGTRSAAASGLLPDPHRQVTILQRALLAVGIDDQDHRRLIIDRSFPATQIRGTPFSPREHSLPALHVTVLLNPAVPNQIIPSPQSRRLGTGLLREAMALRGQAVPVPGHPAWRRRRQPDRCAAARPVTTGRGDGLPGPGHHGTARGPVGVSVDPREDEPAGGHDGRGPGRAGHRRGAGRPDRRVGDGLAVGLVDTGVPGGYRAALNASGRCGSGVPGRGEPGTFASTCRSHVRI